MANIDLEKIEKAIKLILEAIGDNPEREDLIDTPKRVALMCNDLFSGIHKNPEYLFENALAENYNGVVFFKNISFHSICEHHLVPFFGHVNVAFLPKNNQIVGIGKIAELIEVFSKRATIQERLTEQIAEAIFTYLQVEGVYVQVEAQHLCLSIRGPKKEGTTIVTNAAQGIYKSNDLKRIEIIQILNS